MIDDRIDDWRFLIRLSRMDYHYPVTPLGDYYRARDIPVWICGCYGYFLDCRLFSSTGCLDSELL
jgi:hypothetical protein